MEVSLKLVSVIFIIILSSHFKVCFSQKQSFTVKVKDENSNPIKGALVEVKQLRAAFPYKTSESGHVEIPPMEFGVINILIVKNEYIPNRFESRVTTIPRDNHAEIVLKRIPKNTLTIYGEVETKKEIDLLDALVELKIGKLIKDTLTDKSGNFLFLIPKSGLDSRNLILEVKKKGYKSIGKNEKSIVLEEGQKTFLLDVMLKRKFQLEKFAFPFLAGLGAIGIASGTIKFNNAKPIHDDYQTYLTESEFLKFHPEYSSRQEAYLDIESRRKSSRNFITAGATFIIIPFIYKRIKKKKNSRLNISSSSNMAISFLYDF